MTAEKAREARHWFVAALLLLIAAGAAVAVLAYAGPFAPRFASPEVHARRSQVPDWLWLSSFAMVLLAAPGAVICAAMGLVRARRVSAPIRTITVLLAVLLALALLAQAMTS